MMWTNFPHFKTQIQPSSLLVSCFAFIGAVLYCWLAERTQIFDKTDKSSDSRTFLLCIAICALISINSWTPIKKPAHSGTIDTNEFELLPRKQTEEWKGWMQAVILLYHYFGLSHNLPVYQVVRVLVAAYMFLTGYSHAFYFTKTKDFSFDRTTKMLLRLNLLTGVLSYTLNKSCDFYYFPLLTSFWYLVMLATVYSAKTSSGSLNPCRISISLLASCILVQASLYSNTGQNIWKAFLSLLSMCGGPHIDAREFMFRLRLDSIVPYWGALFAVLGPRFSNDALENLPNTLPTNSAIRRFAPLHAPWLAAGIVVQYFLVIQQFGSKEASNLWHPFISIIPIACILVLRNASTRQRQGFNFNFQWLGTISLETYILQSHVWLTNSNKDLLQIRVLGHLISTSCRMCPWLYWLDKFVITIVFLLISHTTARVTKPLVDRLTAGSRVKIVVILTTCCMLNLHWRLVSN